MSTHRIHALALCALTSLGCAKVGLREPRVQETVVSTHPQVVIGSGVQARMEQEETKLTLIATRTCAIREIRDVDRTVRRERYNMSPANDWTAGVLGAGVAGAGAYLIGTASSSATDTSSSSGSKLSPDAKRGIGIGLVAAGVGLLIIPIVDAVRSSGNDEDMSRIQVDGGIVQPVAPCTGRPAPAAHEKVMGRVLGPRVVEVPLGETDGEGRLDVDLTLVITPGMASATLGQNAMSVFVQRTDVGTVNLAVVAAAQEDRAWLSVDVERCVTTATVEACAPLERFTRTFPESRHIANARGALDRAREAVRLQREAEVEADLRRAKATRDAEISATKKAAAGAAAVQAKAQAASVCRQKCAAGCKGVPACTSSCVAQTCH